MNGENFMYDYAEVKIDDKTRVSLPGFTNPKAREKLIFLKQKDFVELWPMDNIIKRINKLNELIFYETDSKKREEYQRMSDEVTAFLKKTHVERDGKRIVIGKKIIDEYNFNDSICIEGKGSYIRLWNPDKFREYQENLNLENKNFGR